MNNTEFSAIEKEMANFNFAELDTHKETAAANIAKAESVADVKEQICSVWGRIGKFVRFAENIPFVGKFIKILGDLLDSVCKS